MAITKVTSRVLEDSSVGVAQLSAGAVTLDKLITSVQQALLPVGAVQAFARTTAPAGWLICNGDAIGTTGTVQGIAASSLASIRSILVADTNPFGVSGSDPLLPDLRGYFVRGHGTNADGTASVGSFGRKQADAFQSHNHTVTDPGHAHNILYYQSTGGGQAAASAQAANSATGGTASASTGISINNTGDTETRPINIALLYCIKY
jgi:microcystin-dependent protein